MSHAGLLLFVVALVLVALSSSLERFKRPEIFDIRATAEDQTHAPSKINASIAMRILVSLLVLSAALFIILSKQYGSDQQKWALGAIGTVLGYWLKA